MARFGERSRFVRQAFWAAVLIAGSASCAAAQQAPRLPVDEDARLALVDYCVLNESARFGQYVNYADRCKCATNAVIATMSGQEMQAVARWRKPTSALKNRWADAWNGCV